MRKINELRNIRRSKRELKKRRHKARGLSRRDRAAWAVFKDSRKALFKKGTDLFFPGEWKGFLMSFRKGEF